jgi:thiol-disulfide isomerase/thioredoxin
MTAIAVAENRTWTDATGKFSVSAELVGVQDGMATLHSTDGKELKVPLEKLSDADRKFIEAQTPAHVANEKPAATAPDKATGAALADIANRFYSDLRTTDRVVAQQELTKNAESLITGGGRSPLTGLPQPQAGNTAIKVGNPKCEGDVAEIPVLVRAGGAVHKTKLHLRKDGDDWRVFAISATYPDGEKSINFEVAQALANVDPLLALVGKPLDIQGFKTDGKKLDMSQYKDKVVLVDFWATWCGPCREEIPNIRENWDKHHGQGFDVIAISVDQDLRALGTFVADEKPPWTVVADYAPSNHKQMDAKLGIRAIPAFILLGKDGNVAAVNCRGELLGRQLDKLLAKN